METANLPPASGKGELFFLEEFLKMSPVFYGLIRSIECRYVSRVDLERPVLDLGYDDGTFRFDLS
jgi:hypothetical protein